MRIEQAMVAEFHKAAGSVDPQKPTMPDYNRRVLRAKLLLEETLETIHKGLGVAVELPFSPTSGLYSNHADEEWWEADDNWREIHPGSLVEIADGAADVKYVTDGMALACGIDMEPVFNEVHRSNVSKFIDGSFREDGKYVKGPSYSRPDIASIIAKQQERQ